jgi:hypothetical protein
MLKSINAKSEDVSAETIAMEVVFTDVDADTLCTEHFIDPAY